MVTNRMVGLNPEYVDILQKRNEMFWCNTEVQHSMQLYQIKATITHIPPPPPTIPQ